MRQITEIRTEDIRGINVLSLLGSNVLIIAEYHLSNVSFSCYCGNTFYANQKLARKEFSELVNDFKTVTKSIEVVDWNKQESKEERVCFICGEEIDYERVSIEQLLSGTRAGICIERPFMKYEKLGSINDLIEIRNIN